VRPVDFIIHPQPPHVAKAAFLRRYAAIREGLA
jgi:hypothetical protein